VRHERAESQFDLREHDESQYGQLEHLDYAQGVNLAEEYH
jgi:hypothetical protein